MAATELCGDGMSTPHERQSQHKSRRDAKSRKTTRLAQPHRPGSRRRGPAPTATPSGGGRQEVGRSRSGPRAGTSRCRSRPESPGRSKGLTASRRCSPPRGEHLRKDAQDAHPLGMGILGIFERAGPIRRHFRHDACSRPGLIDRPRGRPGASRRQRSGACPLADSRATAQGQRRTRPLEDRTIDRSNPLRSPRARTHWPASVSNRRPPRPQ